MHYKYLFFTFFCYLVTPNLSASQACIKANTFAEQQQLATALYKIIRNSCSSSRMPTMSDLIKHAIQPLLEKGASIIGPILPENGTPPIGVLESAQPPIIQILSNTLRVRTPEGAVCITHDEKFGDLIDLLLKHGADINTDGPLTPLHHVIGNKAPFKTVQTILERKANPHSESLGFTPLMYLASTYDGVLFHHNYSMPEERNAVIAFKKIMIALLKAGVDSNTQNIFGWTAIMCLHEDFYQHTIPVLLDANANPYITSYDEATIAAALKTVKLQSYDFFHKPAKDLAHKNFFEIAATATAIAANRRKMQAIDPFTLPAVREALDNYHKRLKVYEETVCAPAMVNAIAESPMILDLAIIIAGYAGCTMPTIIPED